MKKFIIILAVLAIILIGGYFGGRAYLDRQASTQYQNLQTAPAEVGDLTATIGATGAVTANRTAVLTWQTTGIIDQVTVEPGDPVRSEDVLATLQQSSLPQNLILAQAELVTSKRALDDLRESQSAQAQARQAVEDAQQALQDLDDTIDLQRAQAQDAVIKAQNVYTAALEYRDNLSTTSTSPKAQEARQDYEDAEARVNSLRKAYGDMPGDPQTNPAKAKLLIDLRVARIARDQTKAILDLYGDEPTDRELEEAESRITLARAQLEEAQRASDRLAEGPDPVQRALLEAQVNDAQRAYDRVKDGPDPDEIASAEARVAAAQALLDMTRLAAPFDGTVTRVQIKPGEQATPGQVAIQIDDLSHLLVNVNISEVDINRVQIGQPVGLTFDAILGKEYQGEVTEVSPVGSATQGVVEFAVTVELVDPDQDVKPGMTAAVNIVVDRLNDVLMVPNRAVRVREGQRVVYLLEANNLRPVEIELGVSSEEMSQVVSGDLKEGDQIVLNPPTVFDSSGGPPFMRQ